MNVLDLFQPHGALAIARGGATGLGFQMESALAESGAEVVVSSRNLQRCQAMLDTLHPARSRHMALPLDPNEPAAARQSCARSPHTTGTETSWSTILRLLM